MKKHIVKQLNVTAKKIKITYRNIAGSPIMQVIDSDDWLTPEEQSHYDALCESYIGRMEEQESGDPRQDEMFEDETSENEVEPVDGEEEPMPDDESTTGAPEEDPDEPDPNEGKGDETPNENPPPVVTEGADPSGQQPAEPEAAVDYSTVELPTFDKLDIPDFSKMEKDHILWYIGQAEPSVVIEDVRHNFAIEISNTPKVGLLKQQAIDVIFKNLKIPY